MTLGPVTLLLSLPNGGALYQEMLRIRQSNMVGETPINSGAALRRIGPMIRAEWASLGGPHDENGRPIRNTIHRKHYAEVFRYARRHGIRIRGNALMAFGLAGANAGQRALMFLADLRR
ncbi:hypothetical protein OSH11_11850 [Kaistia dalseonensis]|uniref:Uncharacterized protein n=1 Tax=Kaistia dalseonensis TaxID=410840 RepID=A0ABU0H6Q4_9HYPH|nr:hypothetical protein [Kaistia dalseonensis]MCX5495402.1 hypothetical protein [Kaistia dalseonensis]MDQ0437991.1 hypothetical protein [Kaistia dalseonensis]